MNAAPIILAYSLAIFLIGFAFAMKVHDKQSLVNPDEEDFITAAYNKIDKHVKQSFTKLKTEQFLVLSVVFGILFGAAVFLATGSSVICIMGGIIGLLMPELLIQMNKNSAKKNFDERYARSLEQLDSSLRAGLSIQQAVADAAECKFLHEDMRKRYAKMSADMQMGLSVSEAFNRFAEDCGSEDARDVATAIDIQNEIGGREAEVVKEIAGNIRERMMLRKEVKSLFASTSAMVWIMDFICPAVVIYFAATNQDYSELYFTKPLYTMVLVLIIVMMGIGTIINHRTLKRASGS